MGEKSAVIYMYLLKNGASSIAEISKNTKVKRTTVYEQLDAILRDDYAHQVPRGKRVYYVAEEPKNVLRNYEKKKNSFLQNLEEFNKIYDEVSSKPEVRFYSGQKDIKKPYEEILDSKSPIYGFLSDKFFDNQGRSFFNQVLKKIREKDSKLFDLVENSPAGKRIVKESGYDSFYQAKLLPPEINIKNDMLITKDKVLMVSFENSISVLINSSDMAEFLRSVHKHLWKN